MTEDEEWREDLRKTPEALEIRDKIGALITEYCSLVCKGVPIGWIVAADVVNSRTETTDTSLMISIPKGDQSVAHTRGILELAAEGF